jgi:hypothetical protein
MQAAIKEALPTLNTAEQYAKARGLVRAQGTKVLLSELEEKGIVRDGLITTTTKPFLVFARLVCTVKHKRVWRVSRWVRRANAFITTDITGAATQCSQWL